jgi:hypothetical protein
MLKSVNLRCIKKVLPKTEKSPIHSRGFYLLKKSLGISFCMTWVQAADLHNNHICNPDQKVLEFKLIGQGKV